MNVLALRLRAAPKLAISHILRHLPPPNVNADPKNPRAWIALARANFDALPQQTQQLMESHDLTIKSLQITRFQKTIEAGAGDKLLELAASPRLPSSTASAIEEIVRWLTVAQCAFSHRSIGEGSYFDEAERYMRIQWDKVIWPIIKDADFTHTVELACGHGRNTEFLHRLAKSIDLVDVNESCIDACRARFGSEKDGCAFSYHVTSGNVLLVGDATMTFGYSWDSMVHFDKLVVQDHVREFARVLKPGGTAFLHHSNYGAVAPDSSWTKNHGNRSDMTAELMRDYAQHSRLTIKFQRLSGRADGWGLDDLDGLTVLTKPH